MDSTTVRMIVRWSVPAGEARPITASLQSLMVVTRGEPGCTGCSMATDMGNRGPKAIIRYTEEWSNEASLKRQLRSDRFSTLAELIEQSSEHPEVEFVLPSKTRGLDYAEEVREG